MNYKLFVACAALCAVAATAQEDFTIAVPAPQGGPGDAVWIGGEAGAKAVYQFDAVLDGPGMRFEGEPVKNAPYSAEAITESTQTLADGNRIRRENRSLIYRDSQGRTRRRYNSYERAASVARRSSYVHQSRDSEASSCLKRESRPSSSIRFTVPSPPRSAMTSQNRTSPGDRWRSAIG